MAYRKDVYIKTHYQTKDQSIEQLIDHKKKTFFSLFLRQISGVITKDGYFEISSRYNAGAFFEYKGHVVEEVDGIYLKGDIEVKKALKIYMIIISILLLPLSLVFTMAGGVYGVIFMLIMLVEIGVIFGYFKYSDALYKDILRKIELKKR